MADLPPPPDPMEGWYPDPEGSGRMRWWGGECWSDHFLKTRSASGGSGTPGSPKRSGRLGGAPWWAWVLAVIVGIVIIAAIVGRDESSHDNDNDGTTQSEAPAPPSAASTRATKKSLTSCLTSAGVPVDTSGPSAHQTTTIDGEYVGTVTFGRGGSAGLWVMSPVNQLHPIRRAREIAETSGGGYYWDANRNIVVAIPADANLSLGEPLGKKFDACLNG